jgi:hypothetical protein
MTKGGLNVRKRTIPRILESPHGLLRPCRKKGGPAQERAPPRSVSLQAWIRLPGKAYPVTKAEAVPFPGFKAIYEKGIGGFTQPFSKSILSKGKIILRRGNSMRKVGMSRRYLSNPLHIICNTIAGYPKNVE